MSGHIENFNKSNKYKNYNIFDDSKDASKKTTSVRSFEETKSDWRQYCEYWKSYPDRFIDFIRPDDCPINLHFYQRMFLRILFRYRKVYLTFTRGTAKSWTQILAMYLRAIFYPSTKLFICAPGKEQAAKITKDNVEAIWTFFPILKNEVKHFSFQKDYTQLIFHNGSQIDVVQVSDASRGGRRNGGAVEEIADSKMTDKKDLLNSAVIPMMANDRLSRYQPKNKKESRIDPYEKHKSQWYVTTAGTRQSFAFEKHQEVLAEMVRGEDAFVLGAGFELACMHGQLSIDFINELKNQPTYNPLSFAREYDSVWTGTTDNSLVNLEDVVKCRILTKAEDKAVDKDAQYILAYDVSRSEGSLNAQCALVVIKIIPRSDGTYQKHVVNVYSFSGTHFLEQAKFLKRKVNDFKASMLVVDVNGLGKGLVDYLVTQIDENPPYEVVNDERYDKYKTEESIKMVFGISSQTKDTNASDINNVFMGYVSNHKVKFLVSESEARSEISNKDKEKEARALLPYVMTDRMIDEVLNLEYRQEGNKSKVKQISRSINKDKFSALSYGLFYIYLLEMKNNIRKRQRQDAHKFIAVKAPKYKPY